MAKSKVGGTRAYIRGRIGSDVYSIGKTASGQKQQVVRSLAEQVKNPQTLAQMRGRMIMSTVMQAVSAMAMIIDHSFDAYPAGQPNISAFIKENYGLIKADVAAHPSTGNVFGLNKYQEKGIKLGAYVISKGQAAGLPASAAVLSATALTITMTTDSTVGGLKNVLNLGDDDYFTLCAIAASGQFVYSRVNINKALANTDVVVDIDINNLFEFDGNVAVTPAVNGYTITLTPAVFGANNGIIVSRKEDGAYKHSTCVLAAPTSPAWTGDVALATYPEGAQRFLNGGDENFSPSQSVTPTPEPSPSPSPSETNTLTITLGNGVTSINATVDGSPVASGATVKAGKTVNVTIVAASEESKIGALLNGSSISLTQSGANWTGAFTMPSTNATFTASEQTDDEGDQN